MKKFSVIAGFTMMELLVVIALLGILVVGLLSALDPVEQINRGKDAEMQNTVAEYVNALQRYFTLKGKFPDGVINDPAASYLLSSNTALTDINILIAAKELKSNFPLQVTVANNGNRIQANSEDADPPAIITVCYKPFSKARFLAPENVCTSAGICTLPSPAKDQWTCVKSG